MPAARRKIQVFYLVSALFLVLDLFFIVAKGWLWLNLFPMVFAFVLLAFFRPDYLLLLVAFFTPLSLPLKELFPGFSFDMSLPTEPIIVGVLLLFVLKLAQKRDLPGSFLKHPVSLALAVYLIWMFLTSLTGTMVVVSLKYWLSKIWFIVAFYLLGQELLRDKNNFYRFVLLYCSGFLPVIAYAWWRQSAYGFFDSHAANFVMNPFFKDHTSYGAMLVFFIPVLYVMTRMSDLKRSWRVVAGLQLVFFLVALILSYTRAAWLSFFVALGVLPLLWFKVKFRSILIGGAFALIVFFVFQDAFVERLATNKQQSSSKLAGHVESISNISTDASNVERLNRWSSAIAMFKEKPVFGWGPGTYMFQYAPFQRTDLRTIISTNSGDGGNAHSEYLGAMAESGLPGMLTVVLLVLLVLNTGFRVYGNSLDKERRLMVIGVLIALISYFVHGFLNNFLDTDKAAVPVWFFVAVLVVLDLKQHHAKNRIEEEK